MTTIKAGGLTLFSPAIFDGWIWRILVNQVFLSHDAELWDSYSPLMAKFDRTSWSSALPTWQPPLPPKRKMPDSGNNACILTQRDGQA